jgi:rhodanese-related sulfurtransferase
MKKLMDYVAEAATLEEEVMPWDLEEELEGGATPLILDIREPYEFDCMHIDGSSNVPRRVLESACEWDYEETIPELVNSRDRDIVIVCRSGHRSLLAGRTLKEIGFSNVRSLKTGLRGWNDYEMPMVRQDGEDPVIEANADKYFTPQVREDQFKPKET